MAGAAEVEGEVESLVCEGDAKTEYYFRCTAVADETVVVCVDDTIVVEVFILDVTYTVASELLFWRVVYVSLVFEESECCKTIDSRPC